MSQDNRLLPLTPAGNLDRPLRELAQPVPLTGSYSAAAEPTHLRDYVGVILKRKWLILSLVTVVTTLVAIQMYRMPSVYEAETTVQIEQKSRSLIRTKDLVVNAGTDPNYWNTQLKLLENPSLLRHVILRLGLQNNPAFLGGQARPGVFSTLRRVFGRNKAKADEPGAPGGGLTVADDTPATTPELRLTPEQLEQLEPYEDALAGNLTVDPIERTNLVTIRFKHTNPEIARQVADMLAQVFIERDTARETTGTLATKEATAQSITELQQQVASLERQRVDYMRSHGIPLDPNMKGLNEQAARVETLSASSLSAENEVRDLQPKYDAAVRAQTTGDPLSVPDVQESKQVQALLGRLAELQEKREALLQQYTPEWPEVKKLDAQIKQVESARDRATVAIIAGMGAKLEAAKKREASLRAAYGQQRAAATTQSVNQISLGNINQQLESSKQLLNTLIQRRQELDLAPTDQSGTITVQTPARLPRTPVGPPRVRNILIALLLALGAGIGLAFLLDYLDDTLKSIEDVDRHVHLPTLALIPAPREARRLAFGRGAGVPTMEGGDHTALALIEEVRSPVAEAYRHLRTSLLLSSAGQPPKTVLVTSSQPSEGKTTTAVNTAMMLAQTGAEVLILDCDLRRPRLHMHFNLSNTRGITNYLSGDASVSELVQTYDRQPNLKVITSGPVPPNAAELLGSEEMRRLLQVLAENFTHIIIDSPPAISFTDASILSTMVDGVMLVVHGGRSSRAVVRRAKQQLLDVGAHIFGIVLNNVKPAGNDYYYGYGYYSNYYAPDEEGEAAEADPDGRAA